MEMDIYELRELIDDLGYDLSVLEDIEILAHLPIQQIPRYLFQMSKRRKVVTFHLELHDYIPISQELRVIPI